VKITQSAHLLGHMEILLVFHTVIDPQIHFLLEYQCVEFFSNRIFYTTNSYGFQVRALKLVLQEK
jgi:hypothetical protein